ncbi:hypothetical protein CRENBAI_019143 [Crenichthys baileyi]|uniref:Uncharacterized protein n=1 Tax=Crenichthys baileyi TaxID=28760 RepID=A0AAV9SHC2_9TELE
MRRRHSSSQAREALREKWGTEPHTQPSHHVPQCSSSLQPGHPGSQAPIQTLWAGISKATRAQLIPHSPQPAWIEIHRMSARNPPRSNKVQGPTQTPPHQHPRVTLPEPPRLSPHQQSLLNLCVGRRRKRATLTRMDRIRNEYIGGRVHVRCVGDKAREARLRWFGHVKRRDSEFVERRMLRLELHGGKEDMKVVGVIEEDAEGPPHFEVLHSSISFSSISVSVPLAAKTLMM